MNRLLYLIAILFIFSQFCTAKYNQNMVAENFTQESIMNAVGGAVKTPYLPELTVGNLKIEGTLTTPSARIGNWDIREDKIGIPGRGDMNWHTDKWIRILNYDQPWNGTYNGTGIKGSHIHGQSGVLSKGDMRVSGTGNAIFPNATLGQWKIRGDRIGIPGRADMHLHTDKWLRLLEYGQPHNGNYASSNTENGGFAGHLIYRGKTGSRI